MTENNEAAGTILLGTLHKPVHNALRRAGIHTDAQLCALTEHELSVIPNVGQVAIAHVRHVLTSHGMALREPQHVEATAYPETSIRRSTP